MAFKDQFTNQKFLYRNVILLQLFGCFVGIVLIVSGLSAAVVYCNDEGEANLYVLPSFKPDYSTYALSRLQDAGKFECGTYWRMQWAIWSLQVFWLIAFSLTWYFNLLAHFLHGLNSIATVCIAWHVWNAEDLMKLKPVTDDPLYTYGVVSFLGLVACIVTDFVTLFCAGSLVAVQNEAKLLAASQGQFSKHTAPWCGAGAGNGTTIDGNGKMGSEYNGAGVTAKAADSPA